MLNEEKKNKSPGLGKYNRQNDYNNRQQTNVQNEVNIKRIVACRKTDKRSPSSLSYPSTSLAPIFYLSLPLSLSAIVVCLDICCSVSLTRLPIQCTSLSLSLCEQTFVFFQYLVQPHEENKGCRQWIYPSLSLSSTPFSSQPQKSPLKKMRHTKKQLKKPSWDADQ